MPSSLRADGAPFDDVLDCLRERTHLLLGTTIGYSEEQWAEPSGLPGWTRSHVAAHLVGNANGLLRVIRGLGRTRAPRMYDSHADKMKDIERGALAGGMRLQVELDTSASQLEGELPALEGSGTLVELRAGDPMPAGRIPLVRLFEVVIHSIDLGVAVEDLQLPETIAEDLFALEAQRLGRRPDLPRMLLVSDDGPQFRLGGEGEFATVGGPAADLVVWLTRGIIGPRLRGAWPHKPLA